MANVTVIAFDADDTLWHNERFFREAEERFADLLANHCDAERLQTVLLEKERETLHLYGYGVKGFILSMIETAQAVAPDHATGPVIREILRMGRDMLAHPVELLPGVKETLECLSGRFDLFVITKGDLFHQERKLAASGLGSVFARIEIVSEKDAGTYRRIFDDHGQGAARAIMIGNSVKSDILPAIDAGAFAIHVPHGLTWAHEHAVAPDGHPRFRKARLMSDVPSLVDGILSSS